MSFPWSGYLGDRNISPNEESIRKTIDAGANAITYTPPSNGDTMSGLMNKYRNF